MTATGPLSAKHKLFGTPFFVALSIGGLIFSYVLIRELVVRLSDDGVLMWAKFLPLILLISIALAIMAIKAFAMLFRTFDPENPEAYRKPVFPFEDRILTFCIFAGLAAPFVVQPLIDYVVTPALGLEYCETLSSRTSGFGFATHAYVPDPAQCIAPAQD